MSNRKRKAEWILMYRKEEGKNVYIYEPLKKFELQSRKRKGWKRVG